ncbi:MAG: HAD-IA family hydrolase [candidate division SR1 bacterium]|nr:HAD-IA family hydrolase [candidate division SR1 bacterium]
MTKSPLIALIGLPNSGKSTLINRLTGDRKAITAKEEHTTRDLNYGEDFWEGMFLRFVDTGGLVPDTIDKIQKQIQVKSWGAIAEADMLIWVIDRKQNPETISDKILSKVWKTGKPVLICINKVDDPNKDADVSDYARLGGFDFINISAQNGYNLNILADIIVEKSLELGFDKPPEAEHPVYTFKNKKKSRLQDVKTDADGKYYVTRENSEDGPGMFESFTNESTEKIVDIDNVVFDLNNVVFENRIWQLHKYLNEEGGIVVSREKLGLLYDQIEDKGYEMGTLEFFGALVKELQLESFTADNLFNFYSNSNIVIETTFAFIKSLKADRKNIYYLTNTSRPTFESRITTDIFSFFDGGIASFETETKKPDLKIYTLLVEKYQLDISKTIFVDDKEENIDTARDLGMWVIDFDKDITDLTFELDRIETGRVERLKIIPKIILLGKPNVGKSSLFNALADKDMQIVTDIAGTTLSVNDYLLERENKNHKKKQYVLLDSTGIRRPGQRTFGVETFATFRTIEATYQADVACFILDGSQPLTHQDQVVAGICKEAKKGIVMILNKADLVSPEERQQYLRHLFAKFQFLKEVKYAWVSAKDGINLEQIWDLIDESIANRGKEISHEDLRKLFNYIMKKQPPKKLSAKKKAVIYDLVYKKANPPTFELLVKDRETIHWSYMRFLENTLRKQFGFAGASIVVKMVEVKRKRVLT